METEIQIENFRFLEVAVLKYVRKQNKKTQNFLWTALQGRTRAGGRGGGQGFHPAEGRQSSMASPPSQGSDRPACMGDPRTRNPGSEPPRWEGTEASLRPATPSPPPRGQFSKLALDHEAVVHGPGPRHPEPLPECVLMCRFSL